MKTFLTFLVVVWAGFGFASAEPFSPADFHWQAGIPESGEKAFTIWRKGEQVGFQHLHFDRHGDRVEVKIHAEITIKLGFITLFNYVHQNTEIWESGQLVELNSRTDNDGRYEFNHVYRDEGGNLQIAGSHYEGSAPSTILTTSYFIPSFVLQPKLINSQNGQLLAVESKFIGEETIPGLSGDIIARRYRLEGDLALDIWYDLKGGWQKSAFVPKGNTYRDLDPLTRKDVITYVPVDPSLIPPERLWQAP